MKVAPTIEGWLSDEQGRALFEAAASTRGTGAIVEIGSWKGRSTTWLAAGAKRGGHRVYAIDPHVGSREDPNANTLDEFLNNLRRAGVSDVVSPLVMTSSQAAATLQGPVELLFVDGDHTEAAVERDADLWLSRLTERGLVMFHDVATSGYIGPRRVFRRRICWNASFDSIRRIGSMCAARRTPQRSTGAASWGTIVGLLLYLYDVQVVIKRVMRAIRGKQRSS